MKFQFCLILFNNTKRVKMFALMLRQPNSICKKLLGLRNMQEKLEKSLCFVTIIQCTLEEMFGVTQLNTSDEPEPSWLEPGLELNNFQLGSARLVTFSFQLGNFSIKARNFPLSFFFANRRNLSLSESLVDQFMKKISKQIK